MTNTKELRVRELYENLDKSTFNIVLDILGDEYGYNDISEDVVDNMLFTFAEQKEHIYSLFGSKLKIEKEIDTHIPFNEIRTLVNKMVEEMFEKSPKLLFVANLLRTLINSSEIVANEIAPETEFGPRYYMGKKIPTGMKVGKFLTQYCPKEYADYVQTKFSMLLQDIRAKGKIVVSIDPLDYITMSSNASNWSSCHRLNGGEYRSGPLSYLTDNSTIVCYVQSSKPLVFYSGNEEIVCTNKSWRQLAMINPTNAFAIMERQYPNKNLNNTRGVQEIIMSLLQESNQTSYQSREFSVNKVETFYKDYTSQVGGDMIYYNDIVNRMVGECDVLLPKDINIDQFMSKTPLPQKGSAVKCLECGQEYENAESLYCWSCTRDDEY